MKIFINFILIVLINFTYENLIYSNKFIFKYKANKLLAFDYNENKVSNKNQIFSKRLKLKDKQNNKEEEFKETTLRRFDIIFFLSLPIFVGYQIGLHQLLASYADVNGNSGSISVHQVIYISIATIMLSLGVAYHDFLHVRANNRVKRKELVHYFSNPQGFNGFKMNLSWGFTF